MSLSSRPGRSWLLLVAIAVLLVGLTMLAVPHDVSLTLALESVSTGMAVVIVGAVLLALWVRLRP